MFKYVLHRFFKNKKSYLLIVIIIITFLIMSISPYLTGRFGTASTILTIVLMEVFCGVHFPLTEFLLGGIFLCAGVLYTAGC